MITYKISGVNESPAISHTTPVSLLPGLWSWVWKAFKLVVGIHLLEIYFELLVAKNHAISKWSVSQ